jgi:hypothetical protein
MWYWWDSSLVLQLEGKGVSFWNLVIFVNSHIGALHPSQIKGFLQKNYLKALVLNCITQMVTIKNFSMMGKKLSLDISQQIPNPIQHNEVEQFLLQFFDEKRAKETMDRVGIPKSDTIDLNAWVAALADQLQIIIHENEDKQEIIVASYQAYLNNPKEKNSRYIRSLYSNDAIWVENPPAQQNYQVTFYKKITHTWVIHNMGSNVWTGRYLKCIDGDDVSIRPSKKTIPIPDVNPTEIIKLSVEYDSRGKENKAMSVWKMMDLNDQDCFPGEKNALNVVIDVINA